MSTMPVSCRGWLLAAIIMVDSKGGTRLEKSSKLLYRFCGSQLVFALVYNVRQGCAFPTIFGCAETLSSKVIVQLTAASC